MAFGILDGYVTYISALFAVLVGLYLISQGFTEQGLGFIVAGFVAVGIGNKIDRASDPSVTK
jgi:lipoprotein signal peptidase